MVKLTFRKLVAQANDMLGDVFGRRKAKVDEPGEEYQIVSVDSHAHLSICLYIYYHLIFSAFRSFLIFLFGFIFASSTIFFFTDLHIYI